MSKIPFHAFRINYPVRTRELVTKIGIRPVSLDSHSTNVTLSDYFHAVWDTGHEKEVCKQSSARTR